MHLLNFVLFFSWSLLVVFEGKTNAHGVPLFCCGLQGPYGVFAGKDATRYFAKQLVSLEDDDGQPLTSEERMVFVPRWTNRFVSK